MAKRPAAPTTLCKVWLPHRGSIGYSACFCEVVPPLLHVDVAVSHRSRHKHTKSSLRECHCKGDSVRVGEIVRGQSACSSGDRNNPVVAVFGHYFSRFSPAVSSLVSTILPSFLYPSHFSRHAWTSSYSCRRSSRRSFCPVDDHQPILRFLVGCVFIPLKPSPYAHRHVGFVPDMQLHSLPTL